jgi:type VI secretion system secreted protein VgrG
MGSSAQGIIPIDITTPLGDGKLVIRTIHGEERVSGLFHYTLEMVSEDNSLSFDDIVGKKVTVKIALANGSTDYRNGVVGRFVQAGKDARVTTYYADVYSWLWLLTLNTDCKIFQNKSTPDIVKQIFSDAGFTDFKDSLTGTYQPREYCVQYMETSYDFVSRLMEEEGIFYFFEHTSSAHTLVLADDSSAYGTCTGVTSISVRPSDVSWASEESVTECSLEQQVVVGQFKSDDYNFETPSTDLLATASGQDTARSIYEFPGVYKASSDGETITSRNLAGYQASGKILRGTGTCRAFRAGAKFTLTGHSRSDVNADYVLIRLSWRADQSTVYTSSFEAIPATVEFHPPRITPRPKIVGTQTAVVTGKSGEEIWTDQYGRVTVQFFWDQVGQNDEKSSCWIRVAQGWAGKQWGSWFLPRVGQEVVVSFLEGNPDRPLVTGSVYNATQTVPYTLPDDQTKSTIKSYSSKGGGGFNEFRFEDKKDSEEIFMQAQKDLNVTVLNDYTATITNNRKVTISKKDETLIVDQGNRTVQVNTGNETHEVKGKRDLTITGNETHTNKADYTSNVTGNFTLKVSGNISIEASGSVSIKSGTTFNNEAGTSLTNKSGTDLTNQAGTSLTNKAGTTMENNAGVSLTNKASASQTVDGGGMLTLKGGMVKIN